ncbi:MAG: ComEC/Rec2 family competence protein, partial [Planctomycetota bacterium]
TGRVLVRINDEERRLRIGDRISLTGVLSAFPPASNPGEADRADIARRQGLAGLVAVPAREAVVLHESSRWADLRSAFARWRSRLNDAAGGWLIHSVPNSEDERRHALLEAMMLGERGPALDSIDRSFRRVGLSHVLAISGLHLVVLTITVIMLVRAFTGGGGLSIGWPFSRHRSSGLRGCDLSVRQGRANADDASSSDSLIEADAALAWWGRRDRRGRRGSGGRSGGGGGGGGGSAVRMTELIIVILVVGVYLLILPARVPVWRAGLTVIIFAAAGLGGRQAKGASLLALAAAGLLLYNPDDLFEPGFQLSFGIVAAFITLGHAVDLRLRGIMYALNIVIPISSVTVARHADVQPGSAEDAALLSAEEPRTIADFLTLAFWQSLVTSLIAWAVSLPIIAFHFGAVCPIAPIAAVLAMPIVLVLLATGYVKAVATVLFPSVSVLFGPVLALWADMLIGLVDRLETVPLAAVAVPPPGLGWTILATVMIVWLCRQRLPAQPILRLSRRMAVAMCLLWLLVPRGLDMTGLSPIAGRVTMLSVGAGTCTVVEAGGTVFLMDAGSASVSVIGERIIVPALQRRGINRVDSIIISHADADHYNGVLDIVNALRVRRVIITSAIADKMHDAPEAVPNLIALWDHLDKMNITMEVVSAGDTRRIGKAELHWLHPCTSASFEHDNELSALVRIDIAGRRLLLTGDLVDAGLERVLAQVSNEALRADVMELPHHGARPDYLVQMLVERVQPSITLQSASHSRFTDGVQFMQHTTFTSRGVFVNSFGLPVAFGPVHPIVPPQHYATPEGGAITLLIPREDGAITASTFRPRPPKAPSSPSPTPASPSSPSPVVAAGSGQ